MSLLQMSMSAALFTLVVVVIRALAINRLPKKTFLVLWGVVLLRLLIPVSISSPISIYNLVSSAEKNSGFMQGAPAILPTMPEGNLIFFSSATQTAANQSGIPWIPLIWAAGLFLCVIFFAISYWRCRSKFAMATPVQNATVSEWLAAHSSRRKIIIRQSDRINTPLTYGILHPVILLPKRTKWENEKQLQYVLTHEYVHIRRFDTLTKLLLVTALCIHWFNPLIWIMCILANQDLELSCDETVVRSFGETMRSAYALALIDLEERKSFLMPLCNSFSKNAVEERITAIMKIKKVSAFSIVLAFMLVFGVVTVFATSMPAKADNTANLGSQAVPPMAQKYEQVKAEWEQFGVTYDTTTEHVYYNGEMVRFFVDNYSGNSAHFSGTVYDQSDGNYYLSARRDAAGALIAIDEITPEQANEIARWRA